MRGTGGAAVAPASGVIVGSCVHEQQCAQVHAVGDTITTEAVLQLADTCGMVGEIVQETPCPATVGGFPSEGRCVTPQGIDWVYYAHERRDACAAIGGTYTRP